ncbi:DNA internalization-related competence protein ComEC/Rec2 [Rhodoferax lacus]|uniref:DNA internalization-related competence protein ComEC/Rec2 n=1 Tax=Rhodoferax lacus TaxID=2184758 RepID=A0A3E1R6Y9_9BURK|nr:DNA internalization-related competence protein ComEC/Rec2 [Rhodoferax lacus]RFO95135.1 DNA internalization-related competence protein ComEC/Rec2 [Rhodoferax lacus]
MPDSAASDFAVQRNGPFAALLGWVVGTALQLQQGALWPVWAYLALAAPVALAVGWPRRHGFRAGPQGRRTLTWLLCAAALGFAGTGLRGLVFDAQALDPGLEGRDLRVVGVVTEMPQRNEAGLRFTLATDTATLDGRAVRVPSSVDVGWYSSGVGGGTLPGGEPAGSEGQPGDVRAGERWSLTLRLKAPHGSRNPFGFDYELWLWERGVQATAYVRASSTDAPPQRLDQTWTHPVALMRQSVRERIFASVQQKQTAGLIAALVVGDQAAIDRVDWDVFRATGVAHLVSISGLHITMFAWGAAWLVGYLWRRSARLCLLLPAPTAALLGGVLLACAYSVFSGWGIPAQRTCLMLVTVALLRCLGARWPWPQTWMLACALVVASDPWALLQAGFWLSFVAVGVLFATDAGSAQGKASSPAGWLRAVFAHLGSLMREQWVVTVALAPLTLLLFGQVSLVGLLANAFAIPWVTLVVTPLAMLGVALPWLWDLAGYAIAVLMQLLQWLAAWPWATLSLATAPWWLAAAGVLGGVLLVARLPGSVRGMGLPLLLPCLLWQAPLPPDGHFELLAADIGQGNAVLVRTASHALLYDAGPRYSLDSDAGHRVLLPLLQALHTRLDTVLLSHRDTDHVGGAPAVLGMQPQATLLSSVAADDRLQTRRPVQRCEAGQHWEWDGVQFDILHPQAADYDKPHKPNAVSCVLRIRSTGPQPQTALLVGDIERPQEEQLLAAQADIKADVLLVPHHGSKTSSSEAFLDAVQPRQAWVQAGYRNRYGHPAPEVMLRYQERGIVVHDSPHCGAMNWRSDGYEEVICSRTAQMHYWSHRVP